mgnify:CR=1 FL=1
MAWKILIVDDEPDIVEFIQYNLNKMDFETAVAHNGDEAIAIAKSFVPDLILLDVMMPQKDGVETCREIRKIPELVSSFIMFLTARNEEYSEIAGFEAGADDYVYKPIKPRALLSRIQAVLRRKNIAVDTDSKAIEHSGIRIDPSTYIVMKEEENLILPKKEFELLYLLISKPGKVFTREKILNKIWGENVYVVDRTIDVHIRKIREKIGDDLIQTVKGVGYKFVA